MTITQKQNILQYLGYYDGRIDGLWGLKSDQATKDFQKDNDLTQSGVFDEKTAELTKAAVFNDKFKKQTNDIIISDFVVTTPKNDFWHTIKYFGRHEFACKCGKHCDGFPVEPSESLVKFLDNFRSAVGQPVYINSGIRCKQHNINVGGASNSRHTFGDAADIRCIGKTPQELYDIACKMLPNGGVGIYSWGIHVDTRGQKARWKG